MKNFQNSEIQKIEKLKNRKIEKLKNRKIGKLEIWKNSHRKKFLKKKMENWKIPGFQKLGKSKKSKNWKTPKMEKWKIGKIENGQIGKIG